MRFLPCQLGGFGIGNPSKTAAFVCSVSQRVTKPLCQLLLQQDTTYSFETCKAQSQAKSEVHEERRKKQSPDASALRFSLPPSLKFAMSLAQEKGAALSIEKHSFIGHKGAYQDALALHTMGGSPMLSPPIVHATNHSQYHMFFLVLMEDIHPFVIMRFMISQHIS